MICDKCGGSGWRIIEREGVSGAERCDCVPAEAPQDLEAAAAIPPLYRNASLDNFVAAGEQVQFVLLKVRTFVRNFPLGPKPGLLLIGPTGTGKTHLAVGVLRALVARGFEGLFCDYITLLERIRAGWNAEAGASEKQAYQACLDVPVLLLDDLGAQRTSDWVEDTVTGIVTHRCNNQQPLIVTTNLADPDAGDTIVQRSPGATHVEYRATLAEKIGERARSRLFEMCEVVRMPATGDYRTRRR